ncbi:MAG: cytidine deaminase [Candidatus Methanofastidiosia archaeon]
MITDNALMEMARTASENSYSVYSHFQVGAALLTIDNEMYTGCNIENAVYGLSICAERVALFNAVSNGRKKGDFAKIAVAGKPWDGEWQFCSPCGACRQVLYEFAGDTFYVVYLGKNNNIKRIDIKELLPDGFTLQHFCKRF